MGKKEKIYSKILFNNKNIKFKDVDYLLKKLGFDCRINGDHYIYVATNVDEIINLQPLNNGDAKSYQLKQVRDILIKYRLEV